MTWTVGRRIAFGFSFVLALLVAVALLGAWALKSTTATYESALAQRRATLVPALRLESEVRNANSAYLRYLLDADERNVRSRDSALTVIRGITGALRDETPSATGERTWDDFNALLDRWVAASDRAMAARRLGNTTEALRLRATESAPLRQQLEQDARRGVSIATRAADSTARDGAGTAHTSRDALLVGGLLALFAGAASAVMLYNAVARPLQETSGVIASGSTEILAAATEQAAGANETLAAVSETVATVDEVAQTAEQATQRARLVADSAQRAAEIGQAGRRAVEASVSQMGEVRRQVESIGASILALAEQAQAIGEITEAVTDVAEQTNLLALNAAVEAARAGDAGRGFAVVASEIKSLAEQSKRSTVQVRQILGEIQRATGTAVMATEQGTKQVASASRQIEEAGGTIRTLADAVQDAAQTSAQIVASAGQQAIGMEQIRQAIGSIHEATQQNLTASRQSEQAAQDITRLGARLAELVGGERLFGDGERSARGARRMGRG